ncbi:MAG: phosphoribosylformylglycinamidine synthase subunit PurQ [Spirochaetales bacterium]|nr:phosphoribosylformylglycinamidine synthase subunit PurQ [Spirochaetales bacterium]
MIKACIVTGHGINSDNELVLAFNKAGAKGKRVHIQDLIEKPSLLSEYQILAFPGGFSFGDHIGSGLVFAHIFKQHLKDELSKFIADGKPVIGICNGFQILVKMGILPNFSGNYTPEVSLIHNDTGVFENSWLKVAFNEKSPCIWTEGMSEMDIPIRHGEGRFYTDDEALLEKLELENLVALRYSGRNPNGSLNNIAGITDPTGRILGLMPHPEGFIFPENHPLWHRNRPESAAGLEVFRNGVEYVRKNL